MSQHSRNLAKLPTVAFVENGFTDDTRTCRLYSNTDAPIIAIERGEMGFKPIYSRKTAAELNAAEGVTPQQREAMLVGSIFGWHVAGADPDFHNDKPLAHEPADEPVAMRP